MNKIYAGIGSRETPELIQNEMFNIANYLASQKFTLRSGGAKGADTAFQKGAESAKGRVEVYRPEHTVGKIWWTVCAAHYHPAWSRCSAYTKKLHARNTPIILGDCDELTKKSDFVVCWTKDCKASGGTGQGIRIAEAYGIPVFNLYNLTGFAKLDEFLKGND